MPKALLLKVGDKVHICDDAPSRLRGTITKISKDTVWVDVIDQHKPNMLENEVMGLSVLHLWEDWMGTF